MEIDHNQVRNKKTNAQSGNNLKEDNQHLSCLYDTITIIDHDCASGINE
ncbi:7941_t:CDS:1, partial [Cetraspora pellucida]